MYKVTVTVGASDPKKPKERYKKALYEGLYCEKSDSKISIAEIKQSIEHKLRPNLEKQNPTLTLNFKVSVSKLADDFVLVEGKD